MHELGHSLGLRKLLLREGGSFPSKNQNAHEIIPSFRAIASLAHT